MLASVVEKHAPVKKHFSEKGPLNFSKGFRTFRHKTFRQQNGGRRFGNFLLPKRLWCRNVFTAGERRFGNKFSVLPLLMWGHIRCMHARPHRRKDQLPLRSLRDLRFR